LVGNGPVFTEVGEILPVHFWEEARVEKRVRAARRMTEGFGNIVNKCGVKNEPVVS
jgi:hypothetical protein